MLFSIVIGDIEKWVENNEHEYVWVVEQSCWLGTFSERNMTDIKHFLFK